MSVFSCNKTADPRQDAQESHAYDARLCRPLFELGGRDGKRIVLSGNTAHPCFQFSIRQLRLRCCFLWATSQFGGIGVHEQVYLRRRFLFLVDFQLLYGSEYKWQKI